MPTAIINVLRLSSCQQTVRNPLHRHAPPISRGASGSTRTDSSAASLSDTKSSGSFGLRPTILRPAGFAAKSSSRSGNATGKSICSNATTRTGSTSTRASDFERRLCINAKPNRRNSALSVKAEEFTRSALGSVQRWAPASAGVGERPVWTTRMRALGSRDGGNDG